MSEGLVFDLVKDIDMKGRWKGAENHFGKLWERGSRDLKIVDGIVANEEFHLREGADERSHLALIVARWRRHQRRRT